MSHRRPRPLVLCILDGWGERAPAPDNAIAMARTPAWHRLCARWPHARLEASGHCVGLPDGQMGNSEVGHTNIGAGRLVWQDLPRIDAAIREGTLAALPAMRRFVDNMQRSGGTAHVLGLVSPGGVHSHQHQIAALARIVAAAGIPVAVHAVLDGRDTPPKSAETYLRRFEQDVAGLARLAIATVGGRYYAMDRDKRWERVETAYRAIAEGRGERAPDPLAAVAAAYERGESDEFVRPTVIAGYRGMRDGDGLLIANFRADRVREIAAALLDPEFSGFARPRPLAFAAASASSNTRPSSTVSWRHCSPPRISPIPSARSSPRPGLPSCASPRPKNTRMSRFSLTAGAKPSFPERNGSSCRRRRLRPMTCSRKCRRPR